MLADLRNEILDGLQAELAQASSYVEFRVAKTVREGSIWKVFVTLGDPTGFPSRGLDESLEGARAWWQSTPYNGGAEVLSVIPEEEQINLRGANASPPAPGGAIRVYPPKYLECLRDAWTSDEWATLSLKCYRRVKQGENRFDKALRLTSPPLPKTKLRECQSKALCLPGWDHSFLWGPPGTGKTTTLGLLLAAYRMMHPSHRVLLLSTTNQAVDQVLISVDRALEEWAAKDLRAQKAREGCARLGSHFSGKAYDRREHLIPVKDSSLIKQLFDLESNVPEKGQVAAYDKWVQRVERIRQDIHSQNSAALSRVRIAAMTTTYAIYRLQMLREVGTYDLIVFDEASQVGQAHALALMPLGRRSIFAGDPEQLAPIVVSKSTDAEKWLGMSMFDHLGTNTASTIFLHEQSRMAEPICRVVTDVFYAKHPLVVAPDCLRDANWLSDRKIVSTTTLGHGPISIRIVQENGEWSPLYRGPIRAESADRICEIVRVVAGTRGQVDILILTPFRAQRALLKSRLREAGFRNVQVSTVHRAQGTERHTIVFDPVMGNSPFLRTPDARRLVNVALSRAKARLFVFLSADDLLNPIFQQVVHACDKQGVPPARSIEEYFRLKDFPNNALGAIVRIDTTVGRVLGQICESKLQVLELDSGRLETYVIDTLKEYCRKNLSSAKAKGARESASVSPPKRAKTNKAVTSLAKLTVGQRCTGTVSHIEEYGAFIDLGGVTGLLHISEISWGRIKHPSEVLSKGTSIDVVVLSLDPKKQRVSLGFRQLSPAPWQKIEERYSIGQQVTGKVTSILEFGAFVELEPGIVGLIHISKLSEHRVTNPTELVSVGQQLHAYLIDIQPEKRRLSLSLVAPQGTK